jgi:hypothetical protein
MTILDQIRRHAELDGEELPKLRALSVDERSQMIAAVCRDALAVEQGRIDSGLGPVVVSPLPESTLRFLAHQAARLRHAS